MRIAIVGTGIAGLAAAWLLDRRHEVTVFEAADRLGGHANTVTVTSPAGAVAVDTGFIVYNEHNYPNLTRLFAALEVATEASDMSFAVSLGRGRLEYCGSSPAGLFAQRRNLLRPAYLRMLADIVRFNRLGRTFLASGGDETTTLAVFLGRSRLGRLFKEAYLYPMAAAIWSAPIVAIESFPVRRFLAFFDNHGLLTVDGHKAWRTVTGGSRRYVERLVAGLHGTVHRALPVRAVVRHDLGAGIVTADGALHRFDRVVLACHADQALALLDPPTEAEAAILGAFRFQPNRAVLHGDVRLMPRRRRAWASWNYVAEDGPGQRETVSVTYWMNRLQNLEPDLPLFVSLNPGTTPAPALVYGTFDYDHPILDAAAVAAQRLLPRIQGTDRVFFAGAWVGDGFHEDGLVAAMEIARRLGVQATWQERPRADSAIALPERAAAAPA